VIVSLPMLINTPVKAQQMQRLENSVIGAVPTVSWLA